MLENTKSICNACDLIESKDFILKDYTSKSGLRLANQGVTYFEADQIPNAAIFRLSCLNDCRWDKNIKIGCEHIDFYLKHKRMGKWLFAFTPDVKFLHYPERQGFYSHNFRRNSERLNHYHEYFLKKWDKIKIIEGKKALTSKARFWIIHKLYSSGVPVQLISVSEELLIKSEKGIAKFKKLIKVVLGQIQPANSYDP